VTEHERTRVVDYTEKVVRGRDLIVRKVLRKVQVRDWKIYFSLVFFAV